MIAFLWLLCLHVIHEARVLGAHHQIADHVRVVGHLGDELLLDAVELVDVREGLRQLAELGRKVAHHLHVDYVERVHERLDERGGQLHVVRAQRALAAAARVHLDNERLACAQRHERHHHSLVRRRRLYLLLKHELVVQPQQNLPNASCISVVIVLCNLNMRSYPLNAFV